MFWLKRMPKTYKKKHTTFKHHQSTLLRVEQSFSKYITPFTQMLDPHHHPQVNSLGRHYLNEETTAAHQNFQKPYA